MLINIALCLCFAVISWLVFSIGLMCWECNTKYCVLYHSDKLGVANSLLLLFRLQWWPGTRQDTKFRVSLICFTQTTPNCMSEVPATLSNVRSANLVFCSVSEIYVDYNFPFLWYASTQTIIWKLYSVIYVVLSKMYCKCIAL